jgi:hypothetical protein
MARRSRGAAALEPIVLRGTPSRLSVALDDRHRVEEPATASVAADFPGAQVERLRVVGRGGESAAVRLRLAASTPPGRYKGQITVGESKLPAVVEVAPKRRLRAEPSRLMLTGGAGAEVTQSVLLANVGNVPCEVPARSRVGLLAEGAWGGAFWYALTEPNGEGVGRLEKFIDRLAERAAGLAEVRLARAVTIEPGASERVEVTVQLPDGIEAGTTYLGTWEPQGLRLGLRVEGGVRPTRRRAESRPRTTQRQRRTQR